MKKRDDAEAEAAGMDEVETSAGQENAAADEDDDPDVGSVQRLDDIFAVLDVLTKDAQQVIESPSKLHAAKKQVSRIPPLSVTQAGAAEGGGGCHSESSAHKRPLRAACGVGPNWWGMGAALADTRRNGPRPGLAAVQGNEDMHCRDGLEPLQ